MTAALLAACAAVLGIVIGRLWDHRTEATRWRRDKRADSYQQLAAAFRTSYDTIQQIALANTADDGILATDNHVWHNALSGVWIYGTPEAALAATRLDRTLSQLFEDSKNRQHSTSDWAWPVSLLVKDLSSSLLLSALRSPARQYPPPSTTKSLRCSHMGLPVQPLFTWCKPCGFF
ncbi:hypothetical protein [Nocardia canadensis]|uniref:hypothetical protein n=1 Tax=Nocardia canadensis TaxID=3065238 RepID=UPI002930E632|nr:hypothetical protein [Nocardia canadensis]